MALALGLVLFNQLPRWGIVCLCVGIGVSLTFALSDFALRKGLTVAERIGRWAAILALSVLSPTIIARLVWPTVHISPANVNFTGKDETFDFTVSNDTPDDEYDVEVQFALGKKGSTSEAFVKDMNGFAIDLPEAKRANYSTEGMPALYADDFVFGCFTKENEPEIIMILKRINARQSTRITLKRIIDGGAFVAGEVIYFTPEALSYIHEETPSGTSGRIQTRGNFDLRSECKMATLIFAPKHDM